MSTTSAIRPAHAAASGAPEPLDNLMEDAATAEISRAQIWQWIRHGARLENGAQVTADLYREVRRGELRPLEKQIARERWLEGCFELAAALFDRLIEAIQPEDFLTIPDNVDLLKLESANF